MKNWNPESLSERFLFTAESAETYMLECKAKAATREAYKALHDEHLAKFYVFNHLRGLTFFATRDELLSALRSLLNAQPTAPSEAFEGERFFVHRKAFINALIREMEDA